jgi:diguanylate cyclase (GGDEF)-like protein
VRLFQCKRAEDALLQQPGTLTRILEFSQAVQGAGRPEQIFAALSHYLRQELGLAGLAVLTREPDCVPAVQVRSVWPDDLIRADASGPDLDASLCPCLRQNLPRCFKPDGSPVRCAIDSSLSLGPDHAAYCIPFNAGGPTQVLVHMLLPARAQWSDGLWQLAQTYVNTAQSSLITMHMLAEAERQSMTDALTRLYNRRSMDRLLEREVALAERHGHPLSVVMVDLDKFKEINDAHGHAAGDHLLRSFADCVRITLRKTDLAFRYGGDEFVIALPQTAVAQAQQVVGKLRQAFASVDFDSAIANLDNQPTLSIGVAERNPITSALTLSGLLAAADAALYEAKNSTRNCVRVYQPPRAA